jgi:hypothetical protein
MCVYNGGSLTNNIPEKQHKLIVYFAVDATGFDLLIASSSGVQWILVLVLELHLISTWNNIVFL